MDRGDTWRRTGKGLKGKGGALAQDPKRSGRLWAAMSGTGRTDGGLFCSDDSGDTWTAVADFRFEKPVLDAWGGRLVVFGKRPGDEWSKIYYSADNGKTWRGITRSGFRFPTTSGLALDPHYPRKIWISASGRSNALFTIK